MGGVGVVDLFRRCRVKGVFVVVGVVFVIVGLLVNNC